MVFFSGNSKNLLSNLPTISLPTISAGDIPIIGVLLNSANLSISRSEESDEDGLNMPEDGHIDLLVRDGIDDEVNDI